MALSAQASSTISPFPQGIPNGRGTALFFAIPRPPLESTTSIATHADPRLHGLSIAPPRRGGAPAAARDLLTRARVAHLATSDQYARPHVVPIVFVWADPHLYTPIDRKPKRSRDWRALRRVRNIETNGRVSVVVDVWDEDWSRLAYVLLQGTAEIIESGVEWERAAALLAAKYPQYRALPLAGCPIVRVTVERRTEWRGAG